MFESRDASTVDLHRPGIRRWSLWSPLLPSLLLAFCGGDHGNGEPARWTASARGLGPVGIGMTREAAAAVLNTALIGSAETGDCTFRRAAEGLDGVLFMEVMGRIVRIDVTAPGVQTAEGIEVGTPIGRVLEVYRTGVTVGPHKYTDGKYLTVAPDMEHRLVFEADQARVTRYRVGRLPEVEWVEGCA
jgi:hypothetical protein